ncbi:MAG: 5-formyltetrahydrofolate cyclo-ligase [Rhodocyclaceae bacterium]
MRVRLIAARQALPARARSRGSAAIERHLERLLERLAAGVIGFCWPIRGEYDPRALMARLVAQGRKVALPVLVAESAALDFREWVPGAAMDADRYGIPFPAQGRRVHPDVIVIPVVGFDAAGFRLGYGGGYFDRSMAALDPRPIAVGTGFELGRIDSIRPRPHDIPMDWVVTETGMFRRGSSGLSAEE